MAGIAQRLAFVSPCCLVDPSSGASIASAEGMRLLGDSGFHCQAFCAARLDFREDVCLEEVLVKLGLPYDVKTMSVGPARCKFTFTRTGGVPVTIFRNQFTRAGLMPPEIVPFLASLDRFLTTNRPDVVLTYGGGPLGDAIIKLAKQHRCIVVFGLHNCAYSSASAFSNADYAIAPSEFARNFYQRKIGLECHVLPNVIDPQRVAVAERDPKYITFVNPQPAKGTYFVARLAEQLARRRPNIPILIVESRDRTRAMERTRVDLSCVTNLFAMPNTTDPRSFYSVSKALIMPSLCEETFGLVAAEAMLNGIPVLVSDRGALPETVGDAGLVLNIPSQYTPASTTAPTAEEVEPWVKAIIRLWDDDEFYRFQSEKAARHAGRWHPDRLRPIYEEFFRNLHPQPGPPIASCAGGGETGE